MLFHNGREVDAEAVQLNLERIKNPAIGGGWERGAIANIDSVEVLDRYTVRLKAVMPAVSMPSNVMHYPTRLMAPDAFDTAAEHPIGTGPFKFVSWTRYSETRMVRLKTTGRPMPKAITCPTWTKSSANPNARTRCA